MVQEPQTIQIVASPSSDGQKQGLRRLHDRSGMEDGLQDALELLEHPALSAD
jgi:hypothetical protein